MKFTVILSLPAMMMAATAAFSHGDVAPQAVDTAGLPELGEEWLEENPWRDPAGEYWQAAIDIGASGYNQNCARCHGLEVVSGGLAPDLRYLSADWDGDEWYLERFRHGMTQNGITKMPAFGELLGQEAAWAIRTYVETRPDDGAFDDYQPRLAEIRDLMKAHADEVAGGADAASFQDEAASLKEELITINASAATGSDAPVAESAVSRAAMALDGTPGSFAKAAEVLTIGLSAAH
ncbi:cytochrome c-550 PedF [Actibacterium ureilyticum]|uniref:cytochrome c-550 PedF n=1 Tax=Actibacterium ureilyticum TaxID=1590614 RepID=UPI000BAAC638|nr:cytochrome c-550 PedF [Actibacterium ureilyticum]